MVRQRVEKLDAVLNVRITNREMEYLEELADKYEVSISWIVRQLIKTGFIKVIK